jgi:hypothetical protein
MTIRHPRLPQAEVISMLRTFLKYFRPQTPEGHPSHLPGWPLLDKEQQLAIDRLYIESLRLIEHNQALTRRFNQSFVSPLPDPDFKTDSAYELPVDRHDDNLY